VQQRVVSVKHFDQCFELRHSQRAALQLGIDMRPPLADSVELSSRWPDFLVREG
jgi:hypothetical protein